MILPFGRLALTLAVVVLGFTSTTANATTFLGKLFETRYFDVSGSASMCDITDFADYVSCSLQRRQDFSRTVSLERSFDVGWDPAKGELNSITLFWAPVPLSHGFGIGPIADFEAGAKAGYDDLVGWLDVDTDFRFSVAPPPGGITSEPSIGVNHVNIGDALDSCVPTKILVYVTYHCDLYEQQGVDLSNTSTTYVRGAGSSIADYFIGAHGDPTVMMTMDYSATFHFWAEDVDNNNLYTEGRYGEINVAGQFAVRYGYTPSGTPRGGPPDDGGPSNPPDPSTVPLPPALAMMSAGLAGALFWGRQNQAARRR